MINFKVELKLKWSSYCVLFAAGNDNANANEDNVNFTSKDKILYVPVETSSAKETIKNLEDQFIGMNIKQNVKIKIQQMSQDIFSN